MPVRMNASGRLTDGALAVAGAPWRRLHGVTVPLGRPGSSFGPPRPSRGYSARRMRVTKLPSRLLLAFADEAALFQQRVQMHRAAVRLRAQLSRRRQTVQRFQDAHHRLRRFQPAGVHVHRRLGGGGAQLQADGGRCEAGRGAACRSSSHPGKRAPPSLRRRSACARWAKPC